MAIKPLFRKILTMEHRKKKYSFHFYEIYVYLRRTIASFHPTHIKFTFNQGINDIKFKANFNALLFAICLARNPYHPSNPPSN